MNDFPKRSEVWLFNRNPGQGREPTGFKPVLIIQNGIGNERAPTTIVAAISSSVKIYPI
jgi:mRNA-degrading endonuclease toxin of MazEF toxin-antitoxin module